MYITIPFTRAPVRARITAETLDVCSSQSDPKVIPECSRRKRRKRKRRKRRDRRNGRNRRNKRNKKEKKKYG